MSRPTLWTLVVAVVLLARPATAQPLLVEAATYAPLPQASPSDWSAAVSVGEFASGWGTSIHAWVIVTVHLPVRTHITRVGLARAYHVQSQYDVPAPTTLYAAVIRTTPEGLPATPENRFTADDALAHAVFVPDGTDQRIPLDVTLDPGDYGVIFGSGEWGTSGFARIETSGQTALGAPAIRATDEYFWADPVWRWPTTDEWLEQRGPSPLRIRAVVEGTIAFDLALRAVETLASRASVDAAAAKIAMLATAQGVANLSPMLAAIVATIHNFSFTTSGLATAGDVHLTAGIVSSAVASRASQSSVDALAASLDETGDRATRLTIEQALADGTHIASFMVPEASGGQFERVRAVLDQLLTAAAQAGLSVTKARNHFAKGETTLAGADYRSAYDEYANAYQALIK